MALYLAKFSDWGNSSFNGTPGRMSAWGILRRQYQADVAVPNLGMSLKIFGSGANLFPEYDLGTAILTIGTGFSVSSTKNSINANDYILGPSGEVQIFFEVG
jgi:hypothetical protein